MYKKYFTIVAVLALIFTSISPTFAKSSDLEQVQSKAANMMVNVNKADVKTLAKLKHVGHKRAQAIVKYREQHGNFKSVNELMKIKGIGKKTLEVNKAILTI